MKTETEQKLEVVTQDGSVEQAVYGDIEVGEAHVVLSPIATAAADIKQCHEAGLDSMVGSLKHFAKAGSILAAVRDGVDDFSKWCKDNLSFNRKTAYQYIKLDEKVQSGLDLTSGKYTSIRQCLGIDHDGDKSTYQTKRAADPRFESIPGLCYKIEQSWKDALRARPLEDWKPDEKRVLAGTLRPLVEIHDILSK